MSAIHIVDWPTALEPGRGTILDAALRAGVPIPYQCRSGECGRCKCKLVKGSVRHDPYFPEAMSKGEEADGWVLACRARPTSDIEIDYRGRLGDRRMRPRCRAAKIEHRERLNADTVRLVLTTGEGPLPFAAGQYAKLRFGGLPARSYSMANLPGSRHLEFFIRAMPGGLVSGHVARHAAVGDAVEVEGPFGDAFLRPPDPPAIIAVAGGSGLAPMLAIARQATLNRVDCPFHLYFGVRGEADLFAPRALTRLSRQNPKLVLQVLLSEVEPGARRFRSGLPHEALVADFKDLSGVRVYAAGPPPMVAAVSETAKALGAAPEEVFSDPFTLAAREEAPGPGLVSRSLGMLAGSVLRQPTAEGRQRR